MSTFRSRSLRMVFVASFIALVAACGGGGGGGGGSSATLTAPAITQQPQDVSVDDGAAATFAVAATGSSPISYQWRRDGSDIAGATAASYAIGAATMADDRHDFSVVVTNAAGSATSNPAKLFVRPVAPTIDDQPQVQTVLSGATATFSVAAHGTPPLYFQWRKNGVDIPGATSASYVTPALALSDDNAIFDVWVSNAHGAQLSASAAVVIQLVAPAITAQPQNAAVAVGGHVSFSVTASGTAPFTYQWRRNGVDIAGATDATLTISPVTVLSGQGTYSVVVGNQLGSTTSTAATLSMTYSAIDLVAGKLGGFGNTDGIGNNARFSAPTGAAADAAGNIYITDQNAIRKITPAGAVTTLAGVVEEAGSSDGQGSVARFFAPEGLAVDAGGNVYVADRGNHTVRKISPLGQVSTIAGVTGVSGTTDGALGVSLFNMPVGVAVDSLGNVYVTDIAESTIRRIAPNNVVSTFAGQAGSSGSVDDTGNNARFTFPQGLAIDSADNLYVVDFNNANVRKITPAAVVTTITGGVFTQGYVDGPVANARFVGPKGICVDSAGNLYVTDLNNVVRKITPAGMVSTLAGGGLLGSGAYADGTGSAAGFSHPYGLAADGAGNIYVADTENYVVRKVTPAGAVMTWAGSNFGHGYVDGDAFSARFNSPTHAAFDAAGNVYVADTNNNAIRKISPTGAVSTLAGVGGVSGQGSNDGASGARFFYPRGVATDAAGNVYVADALNYTIRKTTPAGVVSTLAGNAGNPGWADGAGAAAEFGMPTSLAVAADGIIYVADSANDTIRKVTPAGVVTTLAGDASEPSGYADGTGTAARFYGPGPLMLGDDGNIYVGDRGSLIRKVTPQGVVTTIAGDLAEGFTDGTGTAARFAGIVGIAADPARNLYVLEITNKAVRKITPAGVVTTVAGGLTASKGITLGPLPGSFSNPMGLVRLPGATSNQFLIMDENSLISITLP